MKKSILALCPSFSDRGGVAYYYSLLNKYFNSDQLYINFYFTGKDYRKRNTYPRFLKTLIDLYSLIRIIPKFDLIILNPSLDNRAVIRDGIFHFVAKHIYKKKTLIFFHGWIPEFFRLVDRHAKKLFKYFYSADKLCVLSKQFKLNLLNLGFKPETITQETTIYEEHHINIKKDPFKIIFLSRFVEGKGCFEVLKTIEILVDEFPNLKLYMVGDGEMINDLKQYVIDMDLVNYIHFTGYLSGEIKYQHLEQCGIMIYPTSYGEGMPISLLEGLGMGLAVVTRPVAGIQDIFTEGENGFLIESLNPYDFAVRIKYLLQNPSVWQAISNRNRHEARLKFEVKNVVKRLENLYLELLQ